MDLLLDTHCFIWYLNGNEQLPQHLKELITDTSNRCFISIASLWEIAIKNSLDRLELKGEFNQIAGFISDNDINVLPILFQHLQHLVQLPFHHRDPFDRIIIAQSLVEGFPVGTKDEMFSPYSVQCIWK